MERQVMSLRERISTGNIGESTHTDIERIKLGRKGRTKQERKNQTGKEDLDRKGITRQERKNWAGKEELDRKGKNRQDRNKLNKKEELDKKKKNQTGKA